MGRILVIDDLESFGHILRKALESLGHQTTHQSSALAGLDLLQKETFDLVLLDYRMPELDGVGTMMGINKLPKAPPVIAYTFQHPSSSFSFEAVMVSLGAISAVRCFQGIEELLQAVKSVFPVNP